MPLPKRETDETERKFINRCMKDDKMLSEFPENDQRLAVCNSLAIDFSKGKKKFDRERLKNRLYKIYGERLYPKKKVRPQAIYRHCRQS